MRAVVVAVAMLASGCGARRDGATDPSDPAHVQVGTASWYGDYFAGRPTATGEIYDPAGMTAASRTLPLGVIVRVTNLRNGRSAVVRINDRGPYIDGRILDCSEGVAQLLGFHGRGLTRVAIDWPPSAVEPPAKGRYWVQLGAFTSPNRARTLRAQAAAHVDSVAVHRQDDLVRVHAGPFKKRGHAEKALEKLRLAGFQGIVVVLDSERLQTRR